jgi:hypothetical protein
VMSVDCPLCDGACAGAELRPRLDSRLHWFWDQIGRWRTDGEMPHFCRAQSQFGHPMQLRNVPLRLAL